MASMFLRSSRSSLEESSSLSEKSRWCPVMHRVPLTGGWSGCRSTTSSTLAFLMCSENSISLSSRSKRKNTPTFRESVPYRPHSELQITSSLLWRKRKQASSFEPHRAAAGFRSEFFLFSVCFDKAPINRRTFMIAWTYPDLSQCDSACWTQGSCGNGKNELVDWGDKRRKCAFPESKAAARCVTF